MISLSTSNCPFDFLKEKARLEECKSIEIFGGEGVNDSILFEEMDYYKNMGLDIIMQPSSPNLYNDMDSIFKTLEDELYITLDLIDDNFFLQLILPGILESTNADSLAGDTLFWSFHIEDYMNDDYIFVASSEINYSARQKWGIIILIFLIIIFTGMKYGTNLRTNY